MMMNKTYKFEYLMGLLWLVLLLIVDLGSKYVFYNLEFFKDSYRFEPVMNVGISFSWNVPYFVVIPLSLVALGSFLYLYQYKTFSKVVLLLLISGTVGNLYDRIIYGGVRDFLIMPNMFIFNFADILLTCGIVFALFHALYSSKSKS